mgnify:CR=1 FL=1
MNTSLDNRIRRVQGQLEKLHTTILEEADCSDVIPQFLAVKGAISSALELYVKESLTACKKNDDEKLEKLIALLARS